MTRPRLTPVRGPVHLGSRARWGLLVAISAVGWIAIGGWLVAVKERYADYAGAASFWVALICGIVSVQQVLVLIARAPGQKLFPVGSWAIVPAAHIVVTGVLAWTIPEPDERMDAFIAVFGYGGLGWFLGPIIVLILIAFIGLALVLVQKGRTSWRQAGEPGRDVLSRIERRSRACAQFGVALAMICWLICVPTFPVGPGSRAGTAILLIVLLVLQALHVVAGPSQLFFVIIRTAYLVGVVAAVQWLLVGLVQLIRHSTDPVTLDHGDTVTTRDNPHPSAVKDFRRRPTDRRVCPCYGEGIATPTSLGSLRCRYGV